MDREAGISRMVHPDRDHAISQKEKLRQAAAPPAQPQQQGQWPPWIAGASTPFQTGAPYPQQAQYPWLHMQPQLGTQTNPAASAAMAQWKENQAFLNRTGNTMQSMISQARMANDQANAPAKTLTAIQGEPCPWSGCEVILTNPHATQEH